jgi:hypothetical protein
MKNFIKLVIGASLLIGTGCSDDLLDKGPQGALDPSKVDASQLQNLRNSVYNQVIGSDVAFYDGYADNGYSRNSWDSHGAKIQTNTVSGSESFGYGESKNYGDKGNAYGAVRVCNLIINKVDEFDKVDEALRSKYKSEARVMRAWHYANLTLFYGDISLVKTVENDFGILTREPKDQVRIWILQEFDEAIALLPEVNDPGRFTKSIAYALKARFAYYFGAYAEAEQAAKYVIDNGGYQLYTIGDLTDEMQKDADFFKSLVDFDQLGIDEDAFIKGIFNYMNLWHAEGNDNPETILAKEYKANEDFGDFNPVTSFLAPNLTNKEAWATIAPIQDLVDAYWMVDGKTKPTLASITSRVADFKALKSEVRTIQNGADANESTVEDNITFSEAVSTIKDELVQKNYMQQFLNRDSRMYASIVFPFSAVNTFVDANYFEYRHDNNNYGETGFVFRKMSGGDDLASVWGDSYFLSGADFPVIRLAEMYLIYAEAHTQTTGFDGSVSGVLNELRTRCGMPNVPAGLGKEDGVNFIRRERRVELAGEGLRYFDIRLYEDSARNGGVKGDQAASVVMNGQTVDPIGNNSANKVWAPRLMYMPIPTLTMDKNPDIIQNDGY